VNEGMKLKLWPSTRVRHPSQLMGQIYLPTINWILLCGCILVVLIFRESTAMEGAYGLAITINMLMTTTLLTFYFSTAKHSRVRTFGIAAVFFTLEALFLVSNLNKFAQGGWFTFAIAMLFFLMMFVLLKARKLRDLHTEFVDLKYYVPQTPPFPRKPPILFTWRLPTARGISILISCIPSLRKGQNVRMFIGLYMLIQLIVPTPVSIQWTPLSLRNVSLCVLS
jgi:hypothetical protein